MKHKPIQAAQYLDKATCKSKIVGKMGCSEHYAMYCYLNYPEFTAQNIFAGGLGYFR